MLTVLVDTCRVLLSEPVPLHPSEQLLIPVNDSRALINQRFVVSNEFTLSRMILQLLLAVADTSGTVSISVHTDALPKSSE